MIYTLLVLFMCLATLVATEENKDFKRGWTRRRISGKYVRNYQWELNWYDARNFCHRQGGNLISIHDNDLNSWMAKQNGYSAWIGASDSLNEGHWVWEDGQKMTENFWNHATHEPNNFNNEDCAVIYSMNVPWGTYGRWNDIDCEKHKLPFACEKK